VTGIPLLYQALPQLEAALPALDELPDRKPVGWLIVDAETREVLETETAELEE
jgi:hypothetical protein